MPSSTALNISHPVPQFSSNIYPVDKAGLTILFSERNQLVILSTERKQSLIDSISISSLCIHRTSSHDDKLSYQITCPYCTLLSYIRIQTNHIQFLVSNNNLIFIVKIYYNHNHHLQQHHYHHASSSSSSSTSYPSWFMNMCMIITSGERPHHHPHQHQ